MSTTQNLERSDKSTTQNVTVNLLDLSTLLLSLIFLLHRQPLGTKARLSTMTTLLRIQAEIGAQLPQGKDAVQP